MDFGRPHDHVESIASRSKIRYLEPATVDSAVGNTPEERKHNVKLDSEVIQAANQTAEDMFLPNDKLTKDNSWMLDASHYTERLTPQTDRIREGDLVVIQESFDKLNFVYCKRGEIYSNRNGHFHHNDIIDKLPFGSKLRSRNLKGYGFCYLLKPTPELWTRSLNHRTQVVHELDQSQIVFQLYLKPNDVVVESGTGSGAMSHGILRTIAPGGQLHTYEFNRHRSETARTEFEQHGLGHLVTVHHKDVCRGIVKEDDDAAKSDSNKKAEKPGFDLPGQSVDAVFLDLPEPWLAVPHAAYILRANTRIASYSPCVEQTQRTVAALEEAGFHSINTFEYRQQEHYVDEVEYGPPPAEKRPKPEPNKAVNYHKQQASSVAMEASPGEDGAGEGDNNVADDDDGGQNQSTDAALAAAGEDEWDSSAVSPNEKESPTSKKRKKQLVARPFNMMRGHSAFLTFATAGIEKQPNPNDNTANV